MANVTAQAVVSQMLASLAVPLPSPAADCDGFKFGDPNTPIEQIVVCRAPTARILQSASERSGATLVISREDPFYLEPSYYSNSIQFPWWSAGLAEAEAANPVIAAKRALMSAGKIVNYRLFARWDASHPRALADSLAQAMSFKPAIGNDSATSYSNISSQTLADLAQSVKGSLKTRSLRATGSPRTPISRIAIVNGMPNVPHINRAIADPRVNAIIVGETCEWEGTPYFQDVISSGRSIGMLLVGYGVSEEPGMKVVAELVRKSASGVPVRVATDSNLAWIS